jgi:hypothetical protein
MLVHSCAASLSAETEVKVAKASDVLQDLASEASILQACSTLPHVAGSTPFVWRLSICASPFKPALPHLACYLLCFLLHPRCSGAIMCYHTDRYHTLPPWPRNSKHSKHAQVLAAHHQVRSSGPLVQYLLEAPLR